MCPAWGAKIASITGVLCLFGLRYDISLQSKSMNSAWQAWQAYTDVTGTFMHLASHPFQILNDDSEQFHDIERLTVVLYDKTSASSSVNETRKDLFCHKNCAMDKLPSTSNAPLQHTRRAVFQAAIWTTSTRTQQVLPSAQDFGLSKVADSWVPVWITIPEVSRSCRELLKCTCKGDCSNCTCGKADLDCSPLCKCSCSK